MAVAPVRLVELLGSLSLACDAADGFAHETTMRSALLAAALACELGQGPEDARLAADVMVGALLRHIGCTAFAVEEAHRYGAGDDVGLRRLMAEVDFGQPERARALISQRLAADAAPAARDAAVANLLGDGAQAGARHDAAQCDAAERLARLLPVSEAAATVARDAFERWDGRGGPPGRAGEDISVVARIVEVAYVAELFRSRQGRGGAEAELRARAGGQLDPRIVACFLSRAGPLYDGLEDQRVPVWERLCAAEPEARSFVTDAQLDDVALAYARFADLKSTWFGGHSEQVAETACAAAALMGLEPSRQRDLRRAGLLHDIGRVAVPTGLWDLPRALGQQERDRVRYHSWETERILSCSPLFGRVVRIAAAAHERGDGSGYHRGHVPEDVAIEAEVLGAADLWCALRAERPHRPARSAGAAHDVIADEVRAGRIARTAADAVLAAAEQLPLSRPPQRPAGLTEREVEVLRLVAGGCSDKRIALDLGITAKTVAHHVQHVYDKIGVRSRAGAALFAVEHRLVR